MDREHSNTTPWIEVRLTQHFNDIIVGIVG